MANNTPINTLVAKRALQILRMDTPFISRVNRDYQADISNREARNGGIINMKKPPRYKGRRGELMKVESTVMPTISTQLQQAGQDVSFSLTDLQLTADGVRNGGADMFLKAAMASIVSQIEADGTALYRQVATSVGSTAVQPTSTDAFYDAGAYIRSQGGSPMERIALLDPFVNGRLASTLKLVYNPDKEISRTYARGMLGSGYGYDFYDEAFIQTHTAGVYGGTPIVTTATGNTVVTSGWTAGSILNAGDTFTLAGVFAINPQTRQSTGKLAFFAVANTATADGSGNMVITTVSPLSPANVDQNQFATVSNLPAASAPLVVTSGASGVASKQSLLFDPTAFTFACVPMATVPGGKGVISSDTESDPESGLSITMTQFYDGPTNQIMTRFDVLYAWLATYPELAARYQSPAA